MTTTLIRIPLTLVAAIAFHVSMSPPKRDVPSLADPKTDRPIDRHATMCAAARLITAMLTKGLFWASALTDVLVLLTPHVRPSMAIPSQATFLAGIGGLPTSLSPPPLCLSALALWPLVTMAGALLAVGGTCLRGAAFDALGQFYACPDLDTCAHAPDHGRGQGGPRHAHALITTGPYAVVRHPGYAGLVACTAGLVVLHVSVLGAGSGARWAMTVSAWGVGMRVGVGEVSARMRAVALGCAVLCAVGAVRRIPKEERALRARFRWEWDAWAERVRYRLIPGVY